jgi:hypothetical protein
VILNFFCIVSPTNPSIAKKGMNCKARDLAGRK